jgi:hypothetical protein
MPISVRALVHVDIATWAAEGRRDDKEEVACTMFPVLWSLRHESTGKKLGSLLPAFAGQTGYTLSNMQRQ